MLGNCASGWSSGSGRGRRSRRGRWQGRTGCELVRQHGNAVGYDGRPDWNSDRHDGWSIGIDRNHEHSRRELADTERHDTRHNSTGNYSNAELDDRTGRSSVIAQRGSEHANCGTQYAERSA